MAGVRRGVSTQITFEESRAVLVHCYENVFDLAAGDCVKKNIILRDTLDTTLNLTTSDMQLLCALCALKARVSTLTSLNMRI